MRNNAILCLLICIFAVFNASSQSVSDISGKKQDEFIFKGKLIDFDIAGSCGHDVHSGIFLFKCLDQKYQDSLFITIPCPREDFFVRGEIYEVKCFTQPTVYTPDFITAKFKKFNYPCFYSTVSLCKLIKE